jgi:GTP cyclohydrolase I
MSSNAWSSDEHDSLDEGAPTAQPNPELAGLTRRLLAAIGEDPDRDGLAKTPDRVARAWEELTRGYHVNVDELVNGAIFEERYDEMVVVKQIRFFSICEHHLLPFFGVASVAYIPNGRVIGLSKIPRIVEMFARRLQLQERLTQQVAQTLEQILRPRGVAVVMEAYHMCMMMRGVEKEDSLTTTSAMLGAFKDRPQTRQEFLNLIRMTMPR